MIDIEKDSIKKIELIELFNKQKEGNISINLFSLFLHSEKFYSFYNIKKQDLIKIKKSN
mgnify:FL=1